MSAVTLQNVLDNSSYLLGESSTPNSEVTKRTMFANDAKRALGKIRNWSWELHDGDALNYVYSATPTNGVYTYTLTPSAGALKDKNSLYILKFTDQNNNVTYFNQVDEPTVDNDVLNGLTNNDFYIKGNMKDGFTLVVNAGASALPTVNVTGGWTYRYFYLDPDFVATTDSTAVPSIKVISEYVAAEVLYGYREQAQYQLARQRYQDTLEDLTLKDMKAAPFQPSAIPSLRQAMGFSTNFKTYY